VESNLSLSLWLSRRASPRSPLFPSFPRSHVSPIVHSSSSILRSFSSFFLVSVPLSLSLLYPYLQVEVQLRFSPTAKKQSGRLPELHRFHRVSRISFTFVNEYVAFFSFPSPLKSPFWSHPPPLFRSVYVLLLRGMLEYRSFP